MVGGFSTFEKHPNFVKKQNEEIRIQLSYSTLQIGTKWAEIPNPYK